MSWPHSGYSFCFMQEGEIHIWEATDRKVALEKSREVTEKYGRKHVVRQDYQGGGVIYFVVPLYERDREGYQHDPGYQAYGVLVAESL